MDISNKTLGLLLVAAIVVSVGGTFFSLDKLDSISTTGYASTTGSGDVNLSINSTISIVMNDSSINFGECNIVTTPMRFDSSLAASTVNNSNCTIPGIFPDYLIVENDGNTDANVTVSVDEIPSTLYGDASSAILEYMTETADFRGGCTGAQTSWTTLSAATTYQACNNLTTSSDSGDRFQMPVRITLPDTATSDADTTMTFTFTASAAS